MFLINFNQWKCACVGINNWVILIRARYKCNHDYVTNLCGNENITPLILNLVITWCETSFKLPLLHLRGNSGYPLLKPVHGTERNFCAWQLRRNFISCGEHDPGYQPVNGHCIDRVTLFLKTVLFTCKQSKI
jgi:hypothetical protein